MEDSKSINLLPRHLNFGRRRILLDYDEVNQSNVIDVLNKALSIHATNRKDCDYLINYFLGDQDILYRNAPSTSSINNKTVVNYAYPITREIVGYTFGSPVEVIAKNANKQNSVQKLNDAYDYEAVYVTDVCSAILSSICGLSYLITLPSSEISIDNTPDIPIVVDYLDPRETFVVQSTSIGNPQIMSCTIIKKHNGKRVYICYTNKLKMTIENNVVTTEPNPINMDPITMVENSVFLTGDWEQAIDVMNASNLVASDSLNDIEGTIRSLLVISGAEFDDNEMDTTLQKIRDNRLLTLSSPSGTNVDAKFISPQLDSTSVQNIREYLDEARNIITGIPDRENNGNGGDTGTAVLNRNGWTDIEIVARLKEMFFKKAKKKQLAIGLNILKSLDILDDSLTTLDLDVSIGLHRSDNISARATTFATLVATGELATIDCLSLSGLTNRVSEMVERGKQAKKEKQEEAIRIAKQSANASGEGNDKNGANKTAEIEKAVANKTTDNNKE